MQLDQLVADIDSAFGEELPFTSQVLSEPDHAVLRRIFGDTGYQGYLHDQVNRQIIRDYLTNAVLLGYLPQQDLSRFGQQVSSREGRSALSLHMLMSSVEQAAELADRQPGRLETLQSDPNSPPSIRLIRS